MMKQISRRDFLRGSAAGMLGIGLTGVFGGTLLAGAEEVTGRMTDDGRTKVIIGTTNNIGSFDPMLSTQAQNRKDCDFLVYETLVFQDSDSVLHNVIAESWEQTTVNTYTVKIHDNVYDTNGNHITANDVKFCFDGLKEGGISCALNVATCEVLDDYTVLFTTEDEDPIMGAIETLLIEMYIVSQESYEASEDQMAANPVGTGPYILTNFQNGTSLTFEAKEDYWNKDGEDRAISSLQNVDVIELQIIGDKSQVAIALQSETIDISDCVASADATFFEEGGDYADDFNMEAVPKSMVMWLVYNCGESAPTNNINLRKAIAYGFSTPDIIAGAENGLAVEVSSFLSTKSVYYDEEWDNEDYYEYNAETAQEYLTAFTEETGIAVSDLNLRILANSNNSATCELLGAYLSMLGISYELLMLDQSVVTTTQTDETAWDLFIQERSIGGTSLKLAWEWFDVNSQSYGNVQFIEDDTLQELASIAAHSSTSSTEAVVELHEYVKEQCYIVGMYQRDRVIAYTKWITGLTQTVGNIVINACSFEF